MDNPPTTSTAFIEQLKDNQPAAWERFRELYIPVILALARENTESETDALALTEGVIEKVAAGMAKFERRPKQRFRNYVKVICLRHISDFLRKQKRKAKKLDPQLFDKQFSEMELRRAIAITKERSRLKDSSWELFHMRFEQKMSVAEIAKAKDLKTETVQKTIRRVVLAVQKSLTD